MLSYRIARNGDTEQYLNLGSHNSYYASTLRRGQKDKYTDKFYEPVEGLRKKRIIKVLLKDYPQVEKIYSKDITKYIQSCLEKIKGPVPRYKSYRYRYSGNRTYEKVGNIGEQSNLQRLNLLEFYMDAVIPKTQIRYLELSLKRLIDDNPSELFYFLFIRKLQNGALQYMNHDSSIQNISNKALVFAKEIYKRDTLA